MCMFESKNKMLSKIFTSLAFCKEKSVNSFIKWRSDVVFASASHGRQTVEMLTLFLGLMLIDLQVGRVLHAESYKKKAKRALVNLLKVKEN